MSKFTPQTSQIRDSLVAELEKGFANICHNKGDEDLRPRFMSRAGEEQQIDGVSWNGRYGYGFAVLAGDLMQAFTADEIRYRDYELMHALEQVIKKNKLTPVITWKRFGKAVTGPVSQPSHYAIQLWE